MKPYIKPNGRVFVVHDIHKGPPLEPVQRHVADVPARTDLPKDRHIPARLNTHYCYTNRKTGAPKARAVFDQAAVFGVRTRV